MIDTCPGCGRRRIECQCKTGIVERLKHITKEVCALEKEKESLKRWAMRWELQRDKLAAENKQLKHLIEVLGGGKIKVDGG